MRTSTFSIIRETIRVAAAGSMASWLLQRQRGRFRRAGFFLIRGREMIVSVPRIGALERQKGKRASCGEG